MSSFTKKCLKEFLPLLKTASEKCKDMSMGCSRSAIINITSKVGSMDDNGKGGSYPYRISKVLNINVFVKGVANHTEYPRY